VVTPSAGTVVTVRFPFSDLSSSKLRPAVVIASSERDDFVLCQITSNPYSDPKAVELNDKDFQIGSLQRTSYARPGKLFTANVDLMAATAGRLSKSAFLRITSTIIQLIREAEDTLPR
jgi:mRNA interferase MazF